MNEVVTIYERLRAKTTMAYYDVQYAVLLCDTALQMDIDASERSTIEANKAELDKMGEGCKAIESEIAKLMHGKEGA